VGTQIALRERSAAGSSKSKLLGKGKGAGSLEPQQAVRLARQFPLLQSRPTDSNESQSQSRSHTCP